MFEKSIGSKLFKLKLWRVDVMVSYIEIYSRIMYEGVLCNASINN